MRAEIRHKFFGGVEVVDAETGRVIAEVESVEEAGELIAGLQAAEDRQQNAGGLLDFIFG